MRTTLIVAVTGRYVKAERFFNRMFESVRSAPPDLDFVFVFDGRQWGTLPTVQRVPIDHRKVRVVIVDEETCLPAILYNRGLAEATGDYVMFCDATSDWHESITNRLLDAIRSTSTFEAAYLGSRHGITQYALPHDPIPGQLYDWLVYGPIIPLSYFIIPRTLAVALGGFDPTPILQDGSGWDFQLRLTKAVECSFLGMVDDIDALQAAMLSSAMFTRAFPASDDLKRRYIMRDKDAEANFFHPAVSCEPDGRFLRDLSKPESEYLIRQMQRFLPRPAAATPPPKPGVPPLRITITGGPWDYHHNWLCFFNYLDHLQGSGFATYQVVHDACLEAKHIIGSDIVFLSRCRTDNIVKIVQDCHDAKVPVIYMIDDNWLWVGRDWPEDYGELFSPGSPAYDNFIFGLCNCDAVLTYNQLLADDVGKFARNVVTLPNSVDLTRFEAIARAQHPRFVVGYAGSPRYATAAFKALAAIGRRPDVDILLMGNVHPDAEGLLAGCRLIRKEHKSYSQYVRDLRSVGPDVLIAPLDDKRTSRSKCPNKFLEITAAGAIGVYSKLEPYTWYVDPGETGLFVEDSNDTHEWISSIERALDQNTIRRIHANARAYIAEYNDVPVVASKFRNLVQSLIERGSGSSLTRLKKVPSPSLSVSA